MMGKAFGVVTINIICRYSGVKKKNSTKRIVNEKLSCYIGVNAILTDYVTSEIIFDTFREITRFSYEKTDLFVVGGKYE